MDGDESEDCEAENDGTRLGAELLKLTALITGTVLTISVVCVRQMRCLLARKLSCNQLVSSCGVIALDCVIRV